MNEVFLIGKIISKIEYKFMTSKNCNAIAKFSIKINNESVINVKGYNNIADKVLRKMKLDDFVFIEGSLNSKCEVIAKRIIKI